MKIIKLSCENFKRLEAIEITPEGNTVIVSGRNGQGKSSVLDSIVAALRGKKHMPVKPIRDGEEKAEIVIETENYIIKRTFTAAGGGTVTITNADGMKASSPQAMLDKLVGEIAFDPMSFINKYDARKQLEVLMKLVGLDFADIDAKIATVKQDRQDVRRDKERFEHDAERITVAEGTPDEEVSVVDLSGKLENAIQHNSKLNVLDEESVKISVDLKVLEVASDQTTATIVMLMKQLENAKARNKEIEEKMVSLERLDDENANKLNAFKRSPVEEIRQQIETAEATNASVLQNQEKAKLMQEVADSTATYAILGKKMKALDAQKATRLADAKFPVEGLSVTEECVVFDGIPLAQVNSAKQLEVGMGIAMAENPKLRVIRMDGNTLDDENLAVIKKMADKEDYQVWIERIVGDGTGIIIEEGKVK